MEWITYKSNASRPQGERDFERLSKKNKEKLSEWLAEKEIISKCQKRAGNRKRAIVKFLTFLNKDYDAIEYQDYVKVCSAISITTKQGVKHKNEERAFIKRFLRENFDDYRTRFKDLKLLKKEQESEENRLTAKDLLADEEIDQLIKATSDLKKKTLIAVLSVSGARPEEVLKVRWSNIDFQNKSITLHSGKTKKTRSIPIDSCFQYIERLKNETNPGLNDLVFSNREKPMSNSGLNFMLKDLQKKAGIKKDVYPYLFRHTRLSFWIQKLSPKVYEQVSGHSLQMGLKTYSHLSQEQIISEMREKVYKIEELKPDERSELIKLREVINNEREMRETFQSQIVENVQKMQAMVELLMQRDKIIQAKKITI